MKRSFTVTFLTMLLATSLYAQKTTVQVPSDVAPGEGNLNNAIQAAINGGTLSNTIFELEPYGYYVSIGRIIVPVGEHLEIVGPEPGTTQQTALPQIVWTPSAGVDVQFNFECYGNITLKNVWLRYADAGGVQRGSSLQIQNNPDPNVQETATFEGVIFDYAPSPPNAGGAVTVAADRFVGTFRNCYFRNCIDTHLRYYGRALSFPYSTTGWHHDYVLFENCTFANIGYVYMQEGGEYGDNVHFNHCTFLNSMMFAQQSGWWYKLSVTNSIYVNTFMYGDIPVQTADGDPNGGTMRIDSVGTFGFAVPFTEQDRRILFANNSYVIQPWLVDWMRNCPYCVTRRRNREPEYCAIPQPMLSPATLVFFDTTDASGNKLFPYMNRADLYDGVDPGFVNTPTNLDSLKAFLNCKWDTNCDHNWAWNPESGLNQQWPLPENLSYSNATLKAGAMAGFPLGDLYHWWPAEYAQWNAQADAERARIFNWLETGRDGGSAVSEEAESGVPSGFTLSQNYPNPFNPITQIEYSIPRAGHVSLQVFNALGEEVVTLHNGAQKAGKHFVTFDGKDLASGIYTYRLQSGEISISKKLVLMK